MRSTLQNDSPYYRGRIAPYNVKHGLIDPSHTMTSLAFRASHACLISTQLASGAGLRSHAVENDELPYHRSDFNQFFHSLSRHSQP